MKTLTQITRSKFNQKHLLILNAIEIIFTNHSKRRKILDIDNFYENIKMIILKKKEKCTFYSSGIYKRGESTSHIG